MIQFLFVMTSFHYLQATCSLVNNAGIQILRTYSGLYCYASTANTNGNI